MDSKTIQKYAKRKTKNLEEGAVKYFNKYIRLRDTDDYGFGRCISSGRMVKYGTRNCQAGHFYSAGSYKSMRFLEDNVHVQSLSDNYYKSSNALEYKKNLIQKIGQDRVDYLDHLSDLDKRRKRLSTYDRRIVYIEVIEEYKQKCKKMLLNKMF